MRMGAVHPPNSTHLHIPDSTGSRAKGRGKLNPNIIRNGIGITIDDIASHKSGYQKSTSRVELLVRSPDGEARCTDQVREGKSAT